MGYDSTKAEQNEYSGWEQQKGGVLDDGWCLK